MSGGPDTNDGGETSDLTESQKERIQEIRDKDMLVRLFKPTTAKIIGVLHISPRDMSATQICEQAGIDKTSFYDKRDFLLEAGVIEQTRKMGQSPLYDLSDTKQAELVAKLRVALH